MPSINTIISNISNQNISLFFENKITSFKPEKDVFTNAVNEETPYSDPIRIGHAELKNHEELLVFTCEYNKELTARSAKKQQFEIAKKVLKEDFKDGAIFIFYDAQGNFRFSFIRRNYGKTGDKKYSTWKRYTYYVTPSETNRTFKERIDKCDYSSLDSIQEAFSVEKLTKQFYNELFAWYQWALSDEIGITYPNNTKTSDDDRNQLDEQVIRLITRLLFVWFIKQKKLVPEYLFNIDELAKTLKDFDSNSLENGNYYNAILQNLFFATLNKEISEREFAKTKDRDIKTRFRYEEMFELSESEIIEYFKPIPFLNGGLFECLDKQDADGNNYFLDGFSRNPTKSANGNFRHRAFIPNCLFFDEEKGIIPLLRRYNFTVEENAPNEVQVALDPELLGKVFENLLGAFNPETKETARKQSGSFYTPREIVEYMVNESLINYLQTKLPNLDEKDLRDLFENENPKSTFLKDSKQCKDIADQLKAIKILDPACGSGAFPMGILSKMVEVLEKLGATNESIHDLKLHLIEECIYGIDIQTIATQISKLRFFITLVVEQQTIDLSKPEDNYGVLTLPNLETKFVSANTLIGIKKKKAGDFVNTLFTDTAIDETKQELLNIRHEHFYAKTAGAKKRLREQDALLRDKLSKLLEENKDFAPDDALQLSQWNPYDQNTSSPFFDMEWMFGIIDGFDVVIGNPPYVNVEKIDKSIKSIIKNFTTAFQKYDLYVLFYEAGVDLLKENGVLSYITSNKFLSQGYGLKLRQLFLKYKINRIINFNYDVFEAATVRTCVFELTKKVKQDNIIKIIDVNTEKDKYLFDNKAYNYINQHIFEKTDNNNFRINLTEKKIKLLEKVESDTLKVEDICSVNYGLRPSSQKLKLKKEAFIHSSNENGKYKPYFEGKDMGYWLIKNSSYLDYRPDVMYNPMFPELFDNNKLVGLRTLSDIGKLRFIYDDDGHYCNDSVVVLSLWENFKKVNYQTIRRLISNTKIETSENYSLEYLQGILNSKLIKFYVNELLYDGTHFYPNHMKQLPIKIKSNLFNEIEKLVLAIRVDNDNEILISKLDNLIYKLYNLTHKEVLIIDPAFSLTQEEYDNYKL